MFSKSPQKSQSKIETLIGAETSIKGDISFSGGLRVDGTIFGNVNELPDVACTLVLSEQGKIEGAINVSHVVVNGVVSGPVTAKKYVELQSKSRVTGDVCYNTLEMHVGAVVEGKLIYLGNADPSQD